MAKQDQTNDAASLKGVIEAALEIARRRSETLRLLRQALVTCDDTRALAFARDICGLDDEKTSNRTDSRIN